MNHWKHKYLKYKHKYNLLKNIFNQRGGSEFGELITTEDTITLKLTDSVYDLLHTISQYFKNKNVNLSSYIDNYTEPKKSINKLLEDLDNYYEYNKETDCDKYKVSSVKNNIGMKITNSIYVDLNHYYITIAKIGNNRFEINEVDFSDSPLSPGHDSEYDCVDPHWTYVARTLAVFNVDNDDVTINFNLYKNKPLKIIDKDLVIRYIDESDFPQTAKLIMSMVNSSNKSNDYNEIIKKLNVKIRDQVYDKLIGLFKGDDTVAFASLSQTHGFGRQRHGKLAKKSIKLFSKNFDGVESDIPLKETNYYIISDLSYTSKTYGEKLMNFLLNRYKKDLMPSYDNFIVGIIQTGSIANKENFYQKNGWRLVSDKDKLYKLFANGWHSYPLKDYILDYGLYIKNKDVTAYITEIKNDKEDNSNEDTN